MSYTARPPFSGGMSNQNQQQQQGGQPNNANIGASGIPNMPMINNAASSELNELWVNICPKLLQNRLIKCLVTTEYDK